MSDTSRRQALRAQQAAQAKAARQRKMIGLGAGIVAVVLAAILIVTAVTSMRPASTDPIIPPNANADRSGITVSAGTAKAGAPTVEIFVDYQCPGCASLDNAFGAKLGALAEAGDIALTIRSRTFLDSSLRNTSSSDATRAAACADTVGAFYAYHLAIFEGQPAKEGTGYTTAQLRTDFPAQAGITGNDLETFRSCYDAKATADFVTSMSEANDKYVYARVAENPNDQANQLWASTPTVSVNGKRLDNSTLNTNDPNSIATAIQALAG